MNKKSFCIIVFLFLLLPFVSVFSLKLGYTSIDLNTLLNIFAGLGDKNDTLIVLDFRLPRVIISILVGIGFSLSGCIIQTVTKNPLADPSLLGINAGAGFIVVIFIVLTGTLTFSSIFAMPLLSFLGAAIVGSIIYALSTQKTRGLNTMRMVLNGVAIQAGLNALMMVIVLQIDSDQFEFLAKWQAGNIWGANWNFVIALTPWILFGGIYIFRKASILDLLALGDELSIGLGVSIKKEKKKLYYTAIALAASSVAISGSINFVGLIAPHLSRRLVGGQHKILLPTTALVGALLVLIADTLSRIVIQPSELPTGIVVSLIGAPYFIYLLSKKQ